MSVPTPLVIFVVIIVSALVFGIYHLTMAFMDAQSERNIYKRRLDEVASRPTYTYSQLLEEVMKSAQPPLSKIDADIQKLVNLAIDPHANYNEASNAAMQACKRLARKG